ncbi:hypothetical protein NMG60_11009867 [Bertholletia excelsa]
MNSQQKQRHGSRGGGACSPATVKVAMAILGACLAGYIVGPPLFWHLSEAVASARRDSCPPCHCDCSSQPLFYIPEGLNKTIFTDCMKHDSESSEEGDKGFTDLLVEELRSKEAEALENQQHGDRKLLEAKKMASAYQKEADKCNSGMETCEEAMEKAQAALVAQRELSAMWEIRARQRGWKEDLVNAHLY